MGADMASLFARFKLDVRDGESALFGVLVINGVHTLDILTVKLSGATLVMCDYSFFSSLLRRKSILFHC